MAPKLTLHYFRLHGRAEVTRLILHAGNIQFEDKIYDKESWQEFKPKTPFGQLPVLEVDGKLLAESAAIERYVAKLANMIPEDAWQFALGEQAVAVLNSAMDLFWPTMTIQDAQERIKAREALLAGKVGDHLKNLSKLVETSPGAYITGDKLSFADIKIYGGLSFVTSGFIDGVPTTLLDNYPVLKAFHNKVASVPAIKSYIDSFTDGSRNSFKAEA